MSSAPRECSECGVFWRQLSGTRTYLATQVLALVVAQFRCWDRPKSDAAVAHSRCQKGISAIVRQQITVSDQSSVPFPASTVISYACVNPRSTSLFSSAYAAPFGFRHCNRLLETLGPPNGDPLLLALLLGGWVALLEKGSASKPSCDLKLHYPTMITTLMDRTWSTRGFE
jgi:hypothetical protein